MGGRRPTVEEDHKQAGEGGRAWVGGLQHQADNDCSCCSFRPNVAVCCHDAARRDFQQEGGVLPQLRRKPLGKRNVEGQAEGAATLKGEIAEGSTEEKHIG